MKLKTMLWNLLEKLKPEEKKAMESSDQSAIYSLQAQVDDLINRCNSIETNISDMDFAIDEAKDLAQDAYNEGENAQDEVSNLRDDLHSEVSDLESKMSSLESDLTDAILTDSLN